MVLSTVLERNPELQHKECIKLDEVFSVGIDEWMDEWVYGWMNGWM